MNKVLVCTKSMEDNEIVWKMTISIVDKNNERERNIRQLSSTHNSE